MPNATPIGLFPTGTLHRKKGVSGSNVEAVAANDVALQHCGQKVVHGHVAITSSRQVLIQITFDVMSEGRTTPEHMCTETSGSDDHFQQRLRPHQFLNETVNLVSHDCHSYLRVTLANRIPHRKAMMMTGENVSMDVDEEVYAADADEMPEAREALDGDKRAIAIASQAGQLAISGETKTLRALRTPEPPTGAARMVHYTTHKPYRGWCPSCVASRARGSLHRRVEVNKTADTLPKFQADSG